MLSAKKIEFCKNEDCPTSNELLDLQRGNLCGTRSTQVTEHLASCEFCSAELAFYSHYPLEDCMEIIEADAISEIPAPLAQLAEALLKNRNGDPSALDALLREKDGLVLDKA
jgi:hypothetical protein